jgi:signal peptide peptidase SppA
MNSDKAQIISNNIHNKRCFLSYMGVWMMDELRFKQLSSLILRDKIVIQAQQGGESVGFPSDAITQQTESGVLIIPISGIIMRKESKFGGTSTIKVKEVIRNAIEDPSVKGILLDIDSPGGHTEGLDELAQVVKAANEIKPIFTHTSNLMASAAYWIGSQVTKINADRMATIGSLGTVMVVQDFSKAFERAGVKTLVLSTGKFKGMLAEGAEVTAEQQEFLQNKINEMNQFFKDAVMEGRNFDKEKTDRLFDGSFELAAKAKDLGLIDEIKTFDETLVELENLILKLNNSENENNFSEKVIEGVEKENSFDNNTSLDNKILNTLNEIKETGNMEIKSVNDLKNAFPQYCQEFANSIREETLKTERKRVSNYLEFIDVDPEIVSKGILSNEEISVSTSSKLAVKQHQKKEAENLLKDNPDDLNLPELQNYDKNSTGTAKSNIEADFESRMDALREKNKV